MSPVKIMRAGLLYRNEIRLLVFDKQMRTLYSLIEPPSKHLVFWLLYNVFVHAVKMSIHRVTIFLSCYVIELRDNMISDNNGKDTI